MIIYKKAIMNMVKKGLLPKKIFKTFDNAFKSLELTNDFDLFDIIKLESNTDIVYYRLRKGKYRAIFYLENNNINVILLDKREDIYRLWQQKL